MTETFDWVKPSLLWQANAQDFRQADFFQPRLLEFRSDSFMDDFLAAAAAEKAAQFQSLVLAPAAGSVGKLFQPIHGRYYLVCGSLCCHLPGYPDRVVRRADGESVFYVLRKLVNGAEYGWTVKEEQKGWKPVGTAPILPDEERLPLFPATTIKGRTLLFGYVPVASRETYLAQASDPLFTFPTPVTDPRGEEFSDTIQNQLDLLLNGTGAPAKGTALAREISLFTLLDLSIFLAANAPNVYASLRGQTPNPALNTAQQALVNYLKNSNDGVGTTLAAAIVAVGNQRQQIERLTGDDPLPFNYDLKSFSPLNAGTLKNLVLAGGVLTSFQQPTQPPAVELPKFAPQAGDHFVLRCVYERAQCDPPHQYVSRRSSEFQLAPFYDPDAPVRQLRIGLPTDVSIAGLRKFKKGVSFMMSSALRNKMASVNKGMLKGDAPGSEGTDTFGHICSFSIPIITLCAFILLFIIVIVLNIVFWWIPLFKICFPLNLKRT